MKEEYVSIDQIDPRDTKALALFQSKAHKQSVIDKQNEIELYKMLNTPQGEKLIQHWVDKWVFTSIASPSDTQIAVGTKQGQANFVMHIKHTIEQLKKGVEDG